MKVLSLLQPWATLAATGKKIFETRCWSTTFRGTVLIHASLGQKEAKALVRKDPFQQALCEWLDIPFDGRYTDLPYGAIIGRVDITDVISTNNILGGDFAESMIISDDEVSFLQLTKTERAFGDYSPDRFAWLLTNPILFPKPIPAKGALKLWNYEFDAETPDVFQCIDCGYTSGVEKFGFSWIGEQKDQLDTFCSRCDSRNIDSILEDETPGL